MGGAKRPSSPEDETGGHSRHGGTRRRNDAVICGKSGRGQNNVSLRSVRKSVICRPMTRAGSVLPLKAFLAAADRASTRQPPSPSPAHTASRPIPTVMHFLSPPPVCPPPPPLSGRAAKMGDGSAPGTPRPLVEGLRNVHRATCQARVIAITPLQRWPSHRRPPAASRPAAAVRQPGCSKRPACRLGLARVRKACRRRYLPEPAVRGRLTADDCNTHPPAPQSGSRQRHS